METRKLYYQDCHLQAFTGRVESCEPSEKGYRIILDQTAFYPEGGGQACDLGTLGGTQVLDVQEENGCVVHLCSGPLAEGTLAEGRIDYDRRFDLMQQHSGEHIVSGLIHARWGCHNVGFHIGADVITIDFDGPVPAEALPEIERSANEAVWKNLPVHIWYPAPEELPHVGYRTKRDLPWPVRIVEFPGYDKCACCGVHVANTGEIGLIKLFSCVRFHQGVRMEMACGKRALDYLSAAFDQNRQVSQAFSARILETGAAARRMNEALAAEKYRAVSLQRQVFAAIADSCRGMTDVCRFEENLDAGLVRELADAIAEKCSGVAAVFCPVGEAVSFCLVTRSSRDLRPLGKELTAAFAGRGGGKSNFQQGSLQGSPADIRAFFEK